MQRIRYVDYEIPEGDWVGDGSGLREWTPEVSCEMAENAMLLAMGAKRAEAELARRAAALAERQIAANGAGDASDGSAEHLIAS